MDLFEHLKNLSREDRQLNTKDDSEIKSYTPYMINRFVSMAEMYVPFVNEINKHSDIPKHVHYRFYNSILPKRNHFFRYIKKKKDLQAEEKKYLAVYFECGIKDIEQYIKILSKDQIKEILAKFMYGNHAKIQV